MNDSRLELDNYIVFYSQSSLISVFDRMKSKEDCALDKAREGIGIGLYYRFEHYSGNLIKRRFALYFFWVFKTKKDLK